MFRSLFAVLMVALCAHPAIASSQRADAVILVNSTSAKYLDFQRYLQPYLDNFGVPYTVLDIATNNVPADLGRYTLIVVGHGQLDTNQTRLTAAAQSNITFAVSLGTGLVNFDGALTNGVGTNGYPYVKTIFNFGYTNPASAASISFPATSPSNQLHYITALHATNSPVPLSQMMSVPGVTYSSNVTAIVSNVTRPLVLVTKYGSGRAVQFTSYDWMAVAVKGPVAGLDDLVWRSLVWAARKPFVMRGIPNFVTMRIDDVDGPLDWAHAAISNGFKPWMGVFYFSVSPASATDLRGMVTNGQATASIHSVGSGGDNWFYYDFGNSRSWSDQIMSNHFVAGTQWHSNNGIPISKMVVFHYSEAGTNAFGGLLNWGVEFVSTEVVPGNNIDALWLPLGPYRLYETRLSNSTNLPTYYADFLPIPGHPELNGKFFNCVTQIRDDAACGEWCPDNDVAGTIGRGTRQLKRAFDSQILATLYSHEWYIHPNPERHDLPAISMANWQAILSGITNNIAGYNPVYVTFDYACQYVRATRTSRLTNAGFNVSTGQISTTFSGKTDLALKINIYTGDDTVVSNVTGNVPIFAASTNVVAAVLPAQPLPTLKGVVQGNQFNLSFPTIPWQDYAVLYSDNLSSNAWNVLTNFTATGTNAICSDTVTGPPQQRFYRLQLSNPGQGFTAINSNISNTQDGQFLLAFDRQTQAIHTVHYPVKTASTAVPFKTLE